VSLTRAEFDRGVEYWFEVGWPRDFHRSFYTEIAAANPRGAFDDVWWAGFLPVLRAWRATRPRGSDYLTARARARFAGLSRTWASALQPHLGSDVNDVEWRELTAFPALVAEIKNMDPPTFTSKFCHFLAPALFPVVDGAAMGSPFATYAACYAAYQREWRLTDERIRRELTLRMRELIGAPLTDAFPMKNKVIELCLIGRNHG